MKVRLNRYLSMCGISSRRNADVLIASGKVKVNGVVVNELGYRIDTETDEVKVGRKTLGIEPKRYVLLNKPRFYLTALGKGEDDKKTIDELITDIPERVYPVGRLDYDTDGLLILTNDGELAHKILHPSYELSKVYRAIVKGKVNTDSLRRMRGGAELKDGYAIPDHIKVVKYDDKETVIEIALHEGRNRLVRRFLSEFGHPVLELKRISVGPIKLGDLPKGSWRYFTSDELDALKKAVGH
ncbi:MAG: pseudouridine synthase [Thermodesulfobacteriota bacterium]